MRTKTMILSAACGLLGGLAAQADSVYSVNVVGYVNTTIPANTWKLIANPLNSSANTLDSVFSSMTVADLGTYLYVWNASSKSYSYYQYWGPGDWEDFNTGDSVNNVDFSPGQGAWIFSPVDLAITFVGDVAQGTLTKNIYTGYNQIASQVPQSGDVTTLGLTNLITGDNIIKRNASGLWDSWTYWESDPGWENDATGDVETPTLNVGEAVWFNSKHDFQWIRTFSVN